MPKLQEKLETALLNSQLSSSRKTRGAALWLTGLPAAGKSTIATALESHFDAYGFHTVVLDGDKLRCGLNKDLGYTDQARTESARRTSEVAKLFVDEGFIAIVALISPFHLDRSTARAKFTDCPFLEIFVDVPLAVAEARDPKGLYRQARLGKIEGFTGIDSKYEPPLMPEVYIDTTSTSPAEAVKIVWCQLMKNEYFSLVTKINTTKSAT